MQLSRTKFQKSFILSTKKWIKCFPGKNQVDSREKSGDITSRPGRRSAGRAWRPPWPRGAFRRAEARIEVFASWSAAGREGGKLGGTRDAGMGEGEGGEGGGGGWRLREDGRRGMTYGKREDVWGEGRRDGEIK